MESDLELDVGNEPFLEALLQFLVFPMLHSLLHVFPNENKAENHPWFHSVFITSIDTLRRFVGTIIAALQEHRKCQRISRDCVGTVVDIESRSSQSQKQFERPCQTSEVAAE